MTVSGVQAEGVVWESMRPCGASVLHSRDDCAPLFRAAVRFRRDDVDLQTARFLFEELLKCRGRRYQLFSFSLDSGTTPQEFIPRTLTPSVPGPRCTDPVGRELLRFYVSENCSTCRACLRSSLTPMTGRRRETIASRQPHVIRPLHCPIFPSQYESRVIAAVLA